MARRSSPYLELNGPVFDQNVHTLIINAAAAGLDELADDADDIMASHIAAGGLVDTGTLLRSVTTQFIRSSQANVGYVKVWPTATWTGSVTVRQTGFTWKQNRRTGSIRRIKTWSINATTQDNRPPGVWLKKGTRGGVKLTKGYDFAGRTATVLRSKNYQVIGDRIAEALNG